MYNVEISKSAIKDLSKLPLKEALKIAKKIQELELNPRPSGCVKLSGSKDKYRVRVGDYRVLYTITDNVLFVHVVKIGNRKEVY